MLALICGSDGGVVSGMRGLAGWLASMSPAARLTFARLDSLGVLLYGDAKNFSIAEKSAIMDRLGGDIAVAASFRWYDWEGRPFAALVTPDMRPMVTQRFADANRSDNQQLLVLALLDAAQRLDEGQLFFAAGHLVPAGELPRVREAALAFS
ncbi:MAG: hypothetical protein REJ50_26665, partial [Bordetella sp.]|nr:hypothetical protein [Bordetella sp.]